jgi:hypothetical protein
MTIRYAAKHGAGLVNTLLAIQSRRAFKAGNLWAETYSLGPGRLTGEPCRGATSRDANEIDYVVYSYGTPIAWHIEDGEWIIPDDKYSVTTSNHQGVVRRAIREA